MTILLAARKIGHVPCLDGLRGFSALWVLLGHALGATGPLSNVWGPVAHPQLAVDIFMFISGFLMMSHFQDRGAAATAPLSWTKFWIRRFFRIAPLYYATIAAVIILRPVLIQAEGDAAQTYDYTDLHASAVLQHLTFVFGVLPDGSWSRPIPDWSLSLEMQFYAVFPLLTVAWVRFGPIATALFAAIACVVVTALAPAYFSAFEGLPSVLPLKLPLFLSGMLVATSLVGRGSEQGASAYPSCSRSYRCPARGASPRACPGCSCLPASSR